MLDNVKKSLQFEVTNRCNLECVYCGNKHLTNKGAMTLADFKTAIRHCGLGSGDSVTLCGYGEPFCNKHIYEMLEYTNALGISTYVQTNGIWKFDEAKFHVFSNSILSFTLDAIDNDIFHLSRPAADSQLILGNIRSLINARKALKSDMPKVYVRQNIFKFNKGQTGAIIEATKSLGCDALFLCQGCAPADQQTTLEGTSVHEGHEGYVHVDPALLPASAPGQSASPDGRQRRDYSFFIDSNCDAPTVRWNGAFSTCCYDVNRQLVLGNAFTDDLKDIASKENYSRLAAQICDRESRAVSGKTYPCDTCPLDINRKSYKIRSETENVAPAGIRISSNMFPHGDTLILFALRKSDAGIVLSKFAALRPAPGDASQMAFVIPEAHCAEDGETPGTLIQYPFSGYACTKDTLAWRKSLRGELPRNAVLFCYDNMRPQTIEDMYVLFNLTSLNVRKCVRTEDAVKS